MHIRGQLAITPNCSFRLIGLPDADIKSLVDSHLAGVDYRLGSDYRDRSRKLLRILLDDSTDHVLLSKLLENSPSDVYVDFFVSAVSEYESVVIEIPDYILDLREKVGGKVCCSYTCI